MKFLNDEKRINEYIKKYNFSKFLSDIEEYRPGFKLMVFEKGSFLFSQPERKYVYFLVDGKFSVYANDENGNQMLVRYCDSFICIGDMEIFGFSEPSNAIVMDSACTFLALDISLYRDKLMSDVVFLRQLASGLAEKLNYFARMQFQNRRISSKQKVVSRILMVGGETLFYKENLRKTAEVMAISYRHFLRILAELVEMGVLKRQDKGYKICNISKLESLYFE